MIIARHVRFKASELIQSLECYGKIRRPSISEAMSYYYNWAMSRGWSLVAVIGHVGKELIWVGAGDRTNQLEMLQLDAHYEVVWRGEDVDGTCDFIEAFPSAAAVVQIIEELENRDWRMHADVDGYTKGAGLIRGEDIYKIALTARVGGGGVISGLSGLVDILESDAHLGGGRT